MFFWLCLFVEFTFSSVGYFQFVEGEVKLLRRGREVRVKQGLKLKPKSTVVTEEGARAVILFTDGNKVTIDENSEVFFPKYNTKKNDKEITTVQMLFGKMRTAVKKKYDGDSSKFRVKVHKAVMGVRGTEFVVETEQQTKGVTFLTLEGETEVGLAGPENEILFGKKVGAGFAVRSDFGKLPGPIFKISKNRLRQINGWSQPPAQQNEVEPFDIPEEETEQDFSDVKQDLDSFELKKTEISLRQINRPERTTVRLGNGECPSCDRVIEASVSEITVNTEIQ